MDILELELSAILGCDYGRENALEEIRAKWG
jgi:hypothetical protein